MSGLSERQSNKNLQGIEVFDALLEACKRCERSKSKKRLTIELTMKSTNRVDAACDLGIEQILRKGCCAAANDSHARRLPKDSQTSTCGRGSKHT